MDLTYMGKVFLPVTYTLSDTDVICGRGRTCFYHAGNVRFREIVLSRLPNYLNAKTKTDKTIVIYDIVNYIRQTSTTQGGGFVKLDKKTGRYFEVGDFLAREKTSQAFRDILHEQYKSSNANKRTIRRSIKDNKAEYGNMTIDISMVGSDENVRCDDEMLRVTPTTISRSANDSVENSSLSATNESNKLLGSSLQSNSQMSEAGSNINFAANFGTLSRNLTTAYAWIQQPTTDNLAESNSQCRSERSINNQTRTIKLAGSSISCPELLQHHVGSIPLISLSNTSFDTLKPADSQYHPPLHNTNDSPASFTINSSQAPMIANQLQKQYLQQQQQQQQTDASMASRNFNRRFSISSSFVPVDNLLTTNNSVSQFPSIDVSCNSPQQLAATVGDLIRSGAFNNHNQSFDIGELLSLLRQSE